MTQAQIEELKQTGAETALRDAYKGKVQHARNMLDLARQEDRSQFTHCQDNLGEAKKLIADAEVIFAELRKLNPGHE